MSVCPDIVQQIMLKSYCHYGSLHTCTMYAWRPPSLSLSYFLCWASLLPMFRTVILSWFCMTSACFLYISVM